MIRSMTRTSPPLFLFFVWLDTREPSSNGGRSRGKTKIKLTEMLARAQVVKYVTMTCFTCSRVPAAQATCLVCRQGWVDTPNNTLNNIIKLIALPCKYGY